MAKKPATSRATISRSKAKTYVTDIRRAAAGIAGLLDTVASNPEWAEANSERVNLALSEALNAVDGYSALLREGLGVD